MTKDEALHIAAKMLLKMMHDDTPDEDTLACISTVLDAEAHKNYACIYRTLEDTKKFINKLQTALKQK